MSEELKPCPFCGGVKLKLLQDKIAFLANADWVVLCKDCGAESANVATEEIAIKAWNTRTPDLEKATAILRDELQKCKRQHHPDDPEMVFDDELGWLHQSQLEEFKRLTQLNEQLIKQDQENGNVLARIVNERDQLKQEAEQWKQKYELSMIGRSSERSAELELDQALAAGGFCNKHKPDGGSRNCLVCACEKLSHALDRISCLCGKPNEMGLSDYSTSYNEEDVVKQVEQIIAAIVVMKSLVDEWQRLFEDQHYDGHIRNTYMICAAKLRGALSITPESAKELLRDKERVDCLEKELCIKRDPYGHWLVWKSTVLWRNTKPLRHAIDAAMKKEGTK